MFKVYVRGKKQFQLKMVSDYFISLISLIDLPPKRWSVYQVSIKRFIILIRQDCSYLGEA